MKSGAHGIENGQSKLGIIPVKRGGYDGARIGGGNDASVCGGVIGDHL